ncbi:YciI family protein [Aquabacterium sp. CECT 9606]|jgi:hypothetical protein|uniref:YciI family protein n=1 Tax=Aquabacterium sp. CECT 9606 TaxID=2845822 RepID=UPI001E639289|nr:YciI family protein [Aquabacterium sp. CECT 9606]CAH0355658.1 hypothetical protein AQB9606_04325 [Aquabacterium sp. CECT 9606]
MRFMIMVKSTSDSGDCVTSDAAMLASMAQYHEQLAKAGVLLDASGLQPSSTGWQVRYGASGQGTVLDGPSSTGHQTLLAGYALIQVRSRAEALEWSRRFPAPAGEGMGAEIEARQLHEQ